MPSLYGQSGNVTVNSSNTMGLYAIANTGNVVTANVSSVNTTGLYTRGGNVYVPSSAQQLLNLLSNNGTVYFQLDPAYANQKVEAFAITGNTSGGNLQIHLVGDVTGLGITGQPVTTTLSNTALSHYTGNITGNTLTISTGIFWANGQAFLSSSYGNSNVAAYMSTFLPTYNSNIGTTRTGNLNTGNVYANNGFFNGNITVGNINVTGVSHFSNVNTTVTTTLLANANVPSTNTTTGTIVSYGGVGIVGDLNVGGNITANLGTLAVGGNITTNSNVVSGQGVYATQYFWANGAPFQSSIYSNANVTAYLAANTDPTIIGINSNVSYVQANLTTFETYANATFATQTALQTLDANVGAFEIYANATFIASATAYGNSNVAAYLAANVDPTIIGINSNVAKISANLGAYEIYANTQIATITANLGAYQLYSNANAAFQETEIQSLVSGFASNVGTYLTQYNGSIGTNNAINFAKKWGYNAGYQSSASTAIAIGDQAGYTGQNSYSIAIGHNAGQLGQGNQNVAVGSNAGGYGQGDYAIAIGAFAGYNINTPVAQVANSIVINANVGYNQGLSATNAGLYIDPVRLDPTNTAQTVYYNTTTKELTYTISGGVAYGNANVAQYLPYFGGNIGGNIDYTTVYTQSFTSNSSWTAPYGVTSINVLVVGGGGGGGSGSSGSFAGGGGGGGNAIVTTYSVTPGTAYTITVGAGGAAGQAGKSSAFGTLSVTGGAAGSSTSGIGWKGAQGIPNGGGTGGTTGSSGTAGGGGASSTSGGAYQTPDGGQGIQTSITGVSSYFGGGGGGGAGGASFVNGTGGAGGGGAGAQYNGGSAAVAGSGQTGGGGGGGSYYSAHTAGAAGGSGIVAISYSQPVIPGTITANTFTVFNGIFWSNGTPFSATSSYGNANVASYLASNTDPTISTLNANAAVQAVQINTLNANVGAFETYANVTFATKTSLQTLDSNVGAFETYANTAIQTINANLGAYQIYANANAASQATSINALNANVGAFETYANTAIQTINANLGAFETYANATFGTSNYGNANVAAYLPVYGGFVKASNLQLGLGATITAPAGDLSLLPTPGGNVLIGGGPSSATNHLLVMGNITSTGYFIGNGSKLSNLPVQAGTYTNANVLSYLSGGTYPGDINATSGVVNAAAINSSGQVTAGTYLQANNGLYSLSSITESYSDGIVVDYTTGNGRISVGTADALTFYAGGPGATPTAVLYPTGNLVLPGSLTMTNGVFWSNGTPYSSGGGSSYGNTQVAAYLLAPGPIGSGTPNTGAFTTLAGTLSTSSQPNITSLGTLTSLAVSGITTQGGNVVITSGTDTTTTTTGALVLTGSGGASIGGNAYVGNNLYVGSNALSLNLTTPTIVAVDNGSTYAQAAIQNRTNTGSADWIAYGNNYPGATNDHGWADVGFTGDAFNDPNYSITKANDAYLFGSGANATVGGNLVLATDYAGSYNDIVFGVGSFYSNSEVARFHGNTSNSGTFNIGVKTTVANITSTNGYFWANGTPYSTGSGSSGVSQIVAGTGISISPSGGTGVVTITNTGGGTGTYGNSNVAAYLPTDPTITAIQANIGTLYLGNISTQANLGAFQSYANSTFATSTSSFNGNLGGQILYDAINERTFANAYPLSTPDATIVNNSYSAYAVYKPVYTNGQVQQPPLSNATTAGSSIVSTSSQVVGLLQSSNIALQSGYGYAGQNRNTVGSAITTYVTPVTANSMTNNDRVRGFGSYLDMDLRGYTWGTMSNTSQNATTITALTSIVNVNGSGSTSTAIGGTLGTLVAPSAGSTANVQYSTSVLAVHSLLSTAGATGKANIAYARLISPSVSGFSANLTIQNLIGLHTYSGWAGTTGAGSTSGAFNAYALLNEDLSTVIQTNGPVIASGNITQSGTGNNQFFTTAGNVQIANFLELGKNYNGSASGTITIGSSTNLKSIQQYILSGATTIALAPSGSWPSGGNYNIVMDFIVAQDATGGRTLTWPGGFNVTGSLNLAPSQQTYARVFFDPSAGSGQVSYIGGINVTAAMTATLIRTITGFAGWTVAVSDNGGQIAYWDTTNNRWSYIQTGGSV